MRWCTSKVGAVWPMRAATGDQRPRRGLKTPCGASSVSSPSRAYGEKCGCWVVDGGWYMVDGGWRSKNDEEDTIHSTATVLPS